MQEYQAREMARQVEIETQRHEYNQRFHNNQGSDPYDKSRDFEGYGNISSIGNKVKSKIEKYTNKTKKDVDSDEYDEDDAWNDVRKAKDNIMKYRDKTYNDVLKEN